MPEPKVGVKLEIDAKQALSASEAYIAALKRIENATNRFAAQSARTSHALGQGLNEAIGSINQQTNVLAGELQSLQQTMGTTSTGQDRLTKSVNRGSTAWTKQVKKIVLWTVGAASAYRMYMKLRRAFGEGIKVLYEHTEEYKRLAAATEKVKLASVLMLGTQEQVRNMLGSIGSAIESTVILFGKMKAVLGGMGVAMRAFAQTGDVAIARLAGFKAIDIVFKDFMEGIMKTSEEVENFDKAIDKLVSTAQRWASAQDEFNERQRKAGTEHWARMADIRDDYFDKIQAADEKYQDAIDDANAKAAKAREKAWSRYYKRIKQLQKRAQRDIQKLIDQHNLQMKHAKQRYDLAMLQSERLYQYQRGLLVAEGDVLAIEDLDARHELEEQAREENFRLQMQQAEALFQLQLKYQKEANRDMVVALRASLQEQLAEIEANRRERVAEAEKERAEDKADADDWRKEEMADEQARYDKQLEANAEYLADMRAQTAKSLADIAREYDLSAAEVNDIWAKVMGHDGEIARLTEQTVSLQETLATQFRDAWVNSLNAVTQAALAWAAVMAMAGAGGSGMGGRPSYPIRGRGRQYGGEDIVSTPTWFIAGESGPERVSVQPLSPIGGAMSLGWSGGPIPVHGSGEFSNADLSGIGDAIAQGIVLTMRDQVLSYRGQRGY